MEVDATKQIKKRKIQGWQEKKATLVNFTQTRQQNTHDSKTNVEIVSKSKVTEISESDNSNKSMKPGRVNRHQVCLKRTRFDAPMKDSFVNTR